MMKYYTDGCRHLVCVPYSRENLHAMADDLGIKRGWFHRDHYDVPKRRTSEIEARCDIVSSKEIVRIIKGTTKIGRGARTKDDVHLFGTVSCPEGWYVEVTWVDEETEMAKAEVDLYSISLSSLDEPGDMWEFDVPLSWLTIEEGGDDDGLQ